MPIRTNPLSRWRWRLLAAVVAIAAVIVLVAARGTASEGAEYRTATVETGDVTQTLTTSGSIESASRSDLTFQVSGTVESVDVAVGDEVTAGQALATLDDADLEDAVDAAEDALAQAEDTLADDLDAQANGTSSSVQSSGSAATQGGGSSQGSAPSDSGQSGGSSGQGGDTGGGTGGDADGDSGGNSGESPDPGDGGSGDTGSSEAVEAAEQAVRDAQQALLDQYDVTAAALETSKAASASAQEVCAAFSALDPSDPTAAEALVACQEATATATTAQVASSDAQAELMIAATALNDAVTELLAAVDGDAVAAPAAYVASKSQPVVILASVTSSRVAAATVEPEGGGASGGSDSSVPTAADILADKAAITAAEADLAVAEAQLDYATLASPVAGTVVAVGVAEGDTVSAGDTTTAITIIADNTYLVNLAVTLTEARQLEVGQAASLTLLSDNQEVEGSVSSVGTVNGGNSFSQTYAVTIAVPDPGFEIRIGTATRMEITVAGATGVLVVPTSAIADATGEATVQVIADDGTAQSVSVTTGAVGSEYTEITEGLESGDAVILADLSLELSGDEDESSTGGLLSGLNEDSSEEQQFQGPGGGNFQPPEGFQPPSGFGGAGQ